MTGLPSRTWPLLDNCRPHGFYLDPTLIPEDDELTDTAAWLAERFDTLALDRFDLDDGGER